MSGIAAVVVAARGGDDLVCALDRAAWADDRIVLDPADRAAATVLPAGIRRIVDPAELLGTTTASWVVLLGEDDLLDAPALAAVRAAVAESSGLDAFALPIVTRALDLELSSGGSIIVAPRGTPIVVRYGATIVLDVGRLRVRRLGVSVVRERGESLTTVLSIVDAEAASVAALADRLGRSHGARGVVWRAVAAMTRVLVARAPAGRLGLGRWVLAVLDGYRVVVTQAKLWERRRDRVVEIG